MFLVSYRSRIAVGWSWMWNYLLNARPARLITGEQTPRIRQFRDVTPNESVGPISDMGGCETSVEPVSHAARSA
jgi:hypothetical protein